MKRKQSKLETAARDHNWLLGRLATAERQYLTVLYDAMEYADADTRRWGLKPDRTKYLVFDKAIRSMVRYVQGRVSDRFAAVKTSELSRHEIVEPTQDFSISKEQ